LISCAIEPRSSPATARRESVGELEAAALLGELGGLTPAALDEQQGDETGLKS